MNSVEAVGRERLINRHSLVVRISHWLNAICLLVLLMSGLQIFNAHPALYWGNKSNFDAPWLAMASEDSPKGESVGTTTIAGHRFNTTGVLGASIDKSGTVSSRGFPSWATLPSHQDLATARRWHFFFAWVFVVNGLVYIIHGVVGGHARRDLVPSRNDLRTIGHSIGEHIRLKFPHGQAAIHYNVLQKLSYVLVAFVILPLLVLAGLTMSPGLDAAFPSLLTVFNGRQSARSIHFLAAAAIVLFVLIHIIMVLLSGVWNNVRSMITGRYDIGPEEHADGT